MNKAVKLEIDNKPVEVPASSTVMDAANKLGITVPHFCYHKKLSIAANCRMCLVHVEKAPKPLPACATPVSEGMKVWTSSEIAVGAQKGVMEFLLINHPLDCPICDQGGECQLQDLAVGYGDASSRYIEKKRVVESKNLGPLVSAEEMARCIHCTRCVRFGQEVAGIMELGMAGRGEHSQIINFVDKTVDSELSGNMIDVCPVGALTSKPFRYAARSWELARLKSIAPHDSLGSNLSVQVKQDKVVRVLPFANEAINECWLSDRDRFSYEGLNAKSRLTEPMLKSDGKWRSVDWATALKTAAQKFQAIVKNSGGSGLSFFGSPQATLEELYLQKKLSVGLESDNFDFRLQQQDFDLELEGIPWLGMAVSELEALDRVLLVGTNIRKEQPLLALKFRKASKSGAEISFINSLDEEFLAQLHKKIIVKPSSMILTLAQIHNSIMQATGKAPVPELQKFGVSDDATAIGLSLVSGSKKGIFVGNIADYHSQRSALIYITKLIAKDTNSTFGFCGGGANSLGGHLVSSVFPKTKRNTPTILSESFEGCLMIHAEADLDFGNPPAVLDKLAAARFVISMSAFDHPTTRDYADLLLPISPFTETAGTFVNLEGLPQRFNGVVRPLGEARPAWKVIRVLGNLLNLEGFNFNVVEDVQSEIQSLIGDVSSKLNNDLVNSRLPDFKIYDKSFERIGEVPIYRSDPIVRRSIPLQETKDGMVGSVGLNSADIRHLGLKVGEKVFLRQNGQAACFPFFEDDAVPRGAVRLPGGVGETSILGPLSGVVLIQSKKNRNVVT